MATANLNHIAIFYYQHTLVAFIETHFNIIIPPSNPIPFRRVPDDNHQPEKKASDTQF